MKLPRDLSGEQLVKALEKHGYKVVRSKASHVRLVHDGPPQHHVTVPLHKALKVGLLSAILSEVAGHLGIDKDSILAG